MPKYSFETELELSKFAQRVLDENPALSCSNGRRPMDEIESCLKDYLSPDLGHDPVTKLTEDYIDSLWFDPEEHPNARHRPVKVDSYDAELMEITGAAEDLDYRNGTATIILHVTTW